MRGKRSILGELAFLNLQVHISKTVNRSEINYLPACSLLNSKQCDVLFRYFNQIFVMYSIPEGNNVTSAGKIARGRTLSMALNHIRDGKQVLDLVFVKMIPKTASGTQRNPRSPS